MNADQTSVYVDRFYEMDPEHEDLLPDGTYLRDGMIVLAEDSMLRAGIPPINEWDADRAKENNRWATVTHLTITPRFGDARSPLISFVAVYGDGTKRKRSYDASYAWFVKKDSVGDGEVQS